MTTAAPDIVARRRHREADRDGMANLDVRPGTGEDSNVSPDRLTQVAQGYPDRSAAPDPRRGDLAANLNAGITPATGQPRSTAGSGERSRDAANQRAKGNEGPAR